MTAAANIRNAVNSGDPGAGAAVADLLAETERLRARVRQLERVQGVPVVDVLNAYAQSSRGWFWETDADLRFTWFSDSVEAVTGVPPQWHYGKTREELGTRQAVSEAQWNEHLQVLARREPFHDFVFRRKGPDGTKWLRTSGVPVFDEAGVFQGYRGTGFDVTPEVTARHAARQLMDAVENLNDLFVLWDADDRLIMCNRRFREINAAVPHTLEAGVCFGEHVRAALAAGLYPQAAGREEEWLEERLRRHRETGEPMEIQRQDGRWILTKDHRLADGSTATVSMDITERKQSERAIEEQNLVLDTALQTIPDGVQVLDADLNLIAWNDRLWDVMDLDGEAILAAPDPGRAFRVSLASRGEYGDGDLEELVASREAIARTPTQVHYERQLVTGKWIECRGMPVPGGGYLAVYRDVDARKKMESELERMATQDELTRLSNRRSFLAALSREIEHFHRHGRELSLLALDLDHFKAINDTHGHGVGDDVLRALGGVLRDVFRGVDCVGRLGGEEFAVALSECDLPQALQAAERLRARLSRMDVGGEGVGLRVTASIGIAPMRRGIDMTELMSDADRALYRAKHAGRDRVVVCGDP